MKSAVSALMDGMLDERAAASTLDALAKSPDLQRDWETWLLIGERLRQQEGFKDAPCVSGTFTERCMRALGQEAALSPKPTPCLHFLIPVAASLLGVAVVGWVGLLSTPLQTAQRPARAALGRDTPLHVDRVPTVTLVVQPAGRNRPMASEYAHAAHSPGASMQDLARYQRDMAVARQQAGR